MPATTLRLCTLAADDVAARLSPTSVIPSGPMTGFVKVNSGMDTSNLMSAADPSKLSAGTPLEQRLQALAALAVSAPASGPVGVAWELLSSAVRDCLVSPSDAEVAATSWYFIVNIVVTESGCKLIADNPASSAQGLGQVVANTWTSVRAKYHLDVPTAVPNIVSAEAAQQQLSVIAALFAGLVPADLSDDMRWMVDASSLEQALSDWSIPASATSELLRQMGGAPLAGLPNPMLRLQLARWKYGNGTSYTPYWAQRNRSATSATHQLWVCQQIWRLYRWGSAARRWAELGLQSSPKSGDPFSYQLFSRAGKLYLPYPSAASLGLQ